MQRQTGQSRIPPRLSKGPRLLPGVTEKASAQGPPTILSAHQVELPSLAVTRAPTTPPPARLLRQLFPTTPRRHDTWRRRNFAAQPYTQESHSFSPLHATSNSQNSTQNVRCIRAREGEMKKL
ncbi:hypothetical protein TRVL_10269 [Trypanosoma vivax]|nr:hypothetical protein TRVL_10269 [Trypanosoma vivax]